MTPLPTTALVSGLAFAGVLHSAVPPWVAPLPLPARQGIDSISVGDERFDVRVTRDAPMWLRIVPDCDDVLIANCFPLEGGLPRLLLLDALGFVVAGANEYPLPRRSLWAQCRGGAAYYLMVGSRSDSMLASIALSSAETSASETAARAVSATGVTDFDIALDPAKPTLQALSIPPARPLRMIAEQNDRPVDIALLAPGGRVLCAHSAAVGLVEAHVVALSEAPHVLVALPLFHSEGAGPVSVRFEPLSPQAEAAALSPDETLRIELPDPGATSPLACDLGSGLWTLEIRGDQFRDHLTAALQVAGSPRPFTLSKTPGQPSARHAFVVPSRTAAILWVTYTSGPGQAWCEVALRRETPQEPGWRSASVEAGAAYLLQPDRQGARLYQLWCYEPLTQELRSARALPQVGGSLLLRPFEDGTLLMGTGRAGKMEAHLVRVEPPSPRDLPSSPDRAFPLVPGDPPVAVHLAADSPVAWLALEAQAGVQYQLSTSEQVSCDIDMVLAREPDLAPIWSDGEHPDDHSGSPIPRMVWTCPETGTYLLRASPRVPVPPAGASFRAHARMDATPTVSPRSITPGPTPSRAVEVAAGTPVHGYLEAWHEGYLKVQVPAGAFLRVDPAGTALVNTSLRFCREDGDPPDGNELATSQPETMAPLHADGDMVVLLQLSAWSHSDAYFQVTLSLREGDGP